MRCIFLFLLFILTACSAPWSNDEAERSPTMEITMPEVEAITPKQTFSARPSIVPTTLSESPRASITDNQIPSTVSSSNTPMPLLTAPSENVLYISELSSSVINACPSTLPTSSDNNAKNDRYENADGTLSTELAGGVVIFTPNGPGHVDLNGSISIKWPWWRTVPGEVIIDGHRLDEQMPPMPSVILRGVPDGYGETGFHPSTLLFPSEGCWEVTARVGEASLSFVTLIVKIPFDPIWPAWVPDELVDKGPDLSEFPQSFRRIYGYAEGGEVELIVETSKGTRKVLSTPEDSKRQVTVKGQIGICFQGAWDATGQWQSEADAGALEWSSDGLSYRISYTGLGLSCQDLLRIAGSSS